MKKPAVVSELESGDKESIDRFITEHEFPIVEPGQATFLFRGPADAVSLRPMIAGFPGIHRFAALNGHDLWWLALALPDGARLEYKLEVQRDHHAEWVNDPLNPITTTNPFGTNSVCRGFGYRVPDFAEIHEGTPNGSFEDQWIASRLGGERKVTVYLPAGFDRDRRYPLVFVHDGGDYLTYGSMALVLDNLIHWKVIPPVIAAFSWPGDRLHEYAANSGPRRLRGRRGTTKNRAGISDLGFPAGDGCQSGSRRGSPYGLETQPGVQRPIAAVRHVRPDPGVGLGSGHPRPGCRPPSPSRAVAIAAPGLSLLRHLRADDR